MSFWHSLFNPKVTLNHPVDKILSSSSRKRMNPRNVPVELHSLIPMVQKWSGVASDSEKYELMNLAESNESYIKELEDWTASWTEEQIASYKQWDDATSLDENHYEFCKFYFMGMVLDGIEIPWPESKKKINPIDQAIIDLQKMTGTAAQATRMWAARNLVELGPDAQQAVPTLQRVAEQDPSLEVRAWALVALGWINNAPLEQKPYVHQLLKKASEEEVLSIESAITELERTPQSLAVQRLGTAAGENDLTTLKKLLEFLKPDEPDKNGDVALRDAVSRYQLKSAQILLDAGADPNRMDQYGSAVLHRVAGKRRGLEMINLLLKYGADPLLMDTDGRTAADIARNNKRTKNVEALLSASPA